MSIPENQNVLIFQESTYDIDRYKILGSGTPQHVRLEQCEAQAGEP